MPVYMDWNQIAGFVLAIAASGVISGLLAGLFGIGGGAVIVPVFPGGLPPEQALRTAFEIAPSDMVFSLGGTSR